MTEIYLLTPSLRRKLKSPLGLLIQGSSEETMGKLEQLINEERPSKLISVGDVVSSNILKQGIQPEVLIVDNKVMRKEITPIQVGTYRTLSLKNQAGTLADEAWIVVRAALKAKTQTRVLVDGEEDLLTLVAVMCAPENSLVVYGQPQKGIVAVKVTEQKKEQVHQIVEAMPRNDERLK